MTNYNNSEHTVKALNSIYASDIGNCLVVIVDNASEKREQEKLEAVRSKYPATKIIYNDINLGYFPGLNVGLNYIKKELIGDYIVYVGNNDIVFPKNMEKQLSSISDVMSEYPVISPDIRTLEGDPQNPHVISRISYIRGLLYDLYHVNYFFACVLTKLAHVTKSFTRRGDEDFFNVSQEICQGYGAMYMLTPLFFTHFSQLTEEPFLLYEEFFLSVQLAEKGYKVFYDPRVTLVHSCKGATGLIPGKLKWSYSKVSHEKYKQYLKENECD